MLFSGSSSPYHAYDHVPHVPYSYYSSCNLYGSCRVFSEMGHRRNQYLTNMAIYQTIIDNTTYFTYCNYLHCTQKTQLMRDCCVTSSQALRNITHTEFPPRR